MIDWWEKSVHFHDAICHAEADVVREVAVAPRNGIPLATHCGVSSATFVNAGPREIFRSMEVFPNGNRFQIEAMARASLRNRGLWDAKGFDPRKAGFYWPHKWTVGEPVEPGELYGILRVVKRFDSRRCGAACKRLADLSARHAELSAMSERARALLLGCSAPKQLAAMAAG